MQGGPGEGLGCCCPHLLSQSRGEEVRSAGHGDELACQWSGPGGYGVG